VTGPGTKLLDPSEVCLVLVTMGDVVLEQITDHCPPGLEVVVWNNATRPYDYRVFGRYMGILETARPVIAFLDDDCYLTRPEWETLLAAYEPGVVTGNMIYDDPVWRARYHDTTLLGWGAIFDRDLPWAAFMRYARHYPVDLEFMTSPGGAEVVFPMLSRCKTVTAGATWLGEPGQEVFGRDNRMSNQPGFLETRLAWLERARVVRDLIASEEAARG
jgi:hypothetical protein